jgi:hypothetical protein
MNPFEAEVDTLGMAEQVAKRLLESVTGETIEIHTDPEVQNGWLDLLLSRCPRHLRVSASAPALAVGCSWALAEAVTRICDGAGVRPDVNRLIDLVTCAPRGPDGGWRGYMRTADGWLTLALGPEDVETWRVFRADNQVRTRLASDICEEAQAWGLACIPVAQTELPSWRTIGGGLLPLPSDPAAALEFDAPRTLSGMRVLDMGALISAPLTCTILGALGADVTSIGNGVRIQSRWYGHQVEEVDFTTSTGRSHLARLCRRADLAVDNFSPRVWTNFGFEPLSFGAKLTPQPSCVWGR